MVRTDDEKRVLEVRLRLPDGSPPAEDRTYSVGLSSYIASSYAFDHKDPGRSLQIDGRRRPARLSRRRRRPRRLHPRPGPGARGEGPRRRARIDRRGGPRWPSSTSAIRR
ncbi:MAG: hypothetical protein M0C28_45500 [Candidatus Moduliflexus flocculans]|nr:hypothetical protein [Candidatus Moduliflexus flocculans]